MIPKLFPFPGRSKTRTNTTRAHLAKCAAAMAAILLAGQSAFASGTVVGWGRDSSGQSTPAAGATNVTALASGTAHTLALRADGTVVGWGDNTFGETTMPSDLTNVTALAAGDGYSLALLNTGKVIPWGKTVTYPLAGLNSSNIVAISAASSNLMVLANNGNVVSMGAVPAPTNGVENIVAISAGYQHSLALNGEGNVIAWGNNTWGQTNVPASLSNVVAIAAGQFHNLALKRDGKVVAWGDNSWGQSSVPANLSNVVAIAAGAYHSMALKQNGTVVVWGDNTYFQTNLPADLTNVVGIAAGSFNNLAIMGDGQPVITSQPVGEYNANSGTAYFQVTASGQTPLSYQWLQDGTNIDGATNALLVLNNFPIPNGSYFSVIVSNALGSVTSSGTQLPPFWRPPECDLPVIYSAISGSGKQGVAFSYTIIAKNNPTTFNAYNLPPGLAINTTNGLISGAPLVSGTYQLTLEAANSCGPAQTNYTLNISSSVPVITSATMASGTEQTLFNYQIKATESPASYGAGDLPVGLNIDTTNGVISGYPLYAGTYSIPIFATNAWGAATANLQLTVGNAPLSGLFIQNVTTNYLSPYLLEFQFSLRDNSDAATGNAVVANPSNLAVTAMENGQVISTNETSIRISGLSAKVLKAYEVLDFSESIASLANGDTNHNGISDAVETEVSAAQNFVNMQPDDAQIGIYEFHRDDLDPQLVQSLTTDKTLLNNDIGGIWINYVQNFPAGSRCWDALMAAIKGLSSTNADEQHVVVFCSDGYDTSSTNTVDDVISAATAAKVQIYCVGFGDIIDTNTLQNITSSTEGRFYEATNLIALSADFAQIAKDLSGQYILRWATLQRSSTSFMPSFQITYQEITADSPTNPIITSTTNVPVLDTNNIPMTNSDGSTVMTNITIYTTNYIINWYKPSNYAGDVKVGSLRLVANADVKPSGVTLRATYVPRYIRQIRLHYRVNWPCDVSLASTNSGDLLYHWSLSQTNDGAGGYWATLSSPDQQVLSTSIPFASFGPLLNFNFHDVLNASNAFSFLTIDNTIYTNTGNQNFNFENTNQFVTVYPALPHGTPVPWLIGYGFTNANNWAANETNDYNGNGLMVWQDYLAGLNPINTKSVFAISSVQPSGPYNQYDITFSTAINRTYRVEVSSDLVTWDTLADGIAGTGSDVTVTDDRLIADAKQMFYRIVVY